MITAQRLVPILGWTGSALATLTYLSFADQVRLNLEGHPGSILLPTVAAVSCSVWVSYSFLKTPKDWPLFVCNVPGIILGILTVVTAIF